MTVGQENLQERSRTIVHIQAMIVSTITAAFAVVGAPPARAVDNVTYEVFSVNVPAANIEYFDHSERRALSGVRLPWRSDVTVIDARSPSTNGAEVRADWRGFVPGSPLPPGRPIGFWVTVRISTGGKVICESTLDVGDAACYGSASFKA